MNLNPFTHLAWKEYRAVRAFWLSIVVLVVLLDWLISAIYYTPTSVVLLYTFGLAAPAFFAIGATGAAFAMEQEEGTFDFLRAVPTTARQVFASKLAVASAATLAMFLVVWPVTLLFTYPKLPDELNGMLGLWLMAALEAIAWGTLFSLLTGRPLVAICLAIAAASTVTHLLAWCMATGRVYEFEFARYLAAVPWRALVVAGVMAADIHLGLRWLDVEAREKIKLPIRRRNIRGSDRGSPAESSAAKGLLGKPDRGAMFSHLLWQHWRQSGWLMALMAVLHVTLTVLIIFSGFSQSQKDAVLPMAALAGLIGCCVFLSDQERRQYRFFLEHSIPPRYVWLSRQLLWIITLFVSSLAICLFWVPSASISSLWQIIRTATNSWPMFDWAWQSQRLGYAYDFIPFVELPPLAIGLVCVALSYAAGQWTSMFVRSGIMAGFFGLLLSGVLCLWVALMYAMQVSFLWSVAPIPVVLLWATWLRAPDWARENTLWTARGKAVAAIVIPAMALCVAVPSYRVRQIPRVDPGFDPAQFLSGITTDGRRTAELYRSASELYVGATLLAGAEHAERGDRRPTTAERRWLEANAEPLALLLEASRRPTCDFSDPSTLTEQPWLRNEHGMTSLVLTSGRQLESEGKLDDALDRYFAALRVYIHRKDKGLLRDAPRVFSEFTEWAAQKGQNPGRIVGAIKRLQAIDADTLGLDDGLKSEYIVAKRAVFGDLGAWSALTGHAANDNEIMSRALWGKLMPWEEYRGLRMLNLLTEISLDRLRQMRNSLAADQGVVDFLVPSQNWSPIQEFSVEYDPFYRQYSESREKAEWLATTYTVPGIGFSGSFAARELAQFEARRRGRLILLALEAHRLEHGALPQSLAELVGPYLDKLKLDPYSGLEFRYFPAGLPNPASPLEAAELSNERSWPPMPSPINDVNPGKPCVWCTGPHLRANTWIVNEPKEGSGTTAEKPEQVVYYTSRDNPYGSQPLPQNIAWRQGFWFPIPDQRQ